MAGVLSCQDLRRAIELEPKSLEIKRCLEKALLQQRVDDRERQGVWGLSLYEDGAHSGLSEDAWNGAQRCFNDPIL